MANFTTRSLKITILAVLSSARKAHRSTLVGGRGNTRGDIDRRLDVVFEHQDRQLADVAISELLKAGMISPTYDDVIDPANWLTITEAGRSALGRQLLDDLDDALSNISPHLVELREGAWAAIASTQPDALRQSAHSGRELLVQTLRARFKTLSAAL